MICHFEPSIARGTVAAPPSKSMAHRLLILAALAEGESRIESPGSSDDVLATADCLRTLGAEIDVSEDGARIRGTDPRGLHRPVTLDCRESGSTLRFLLPLALRSGEEVRLIGSPRLFQRPLSVYEDLAVKQGWTLERNINGLLVQGALQPGSYTIPGDVSSQFATGLLLALPLLDGESTLRLLKPVESRPYLELTLESLQSFGIRIEREEPFFFRIPGGQRPQARCLRVEGDWSGAAFLEALNSLGGNVTVTGLDPESRQGDRCFKEFCGRLGKREISLADCPDLGPILFALAAAGGGGRFTDTARLRDKESDRCLAMAQELQKLGAEVTMGENSVEIYSGRLHPPETVLDSHNDHRIAMALSVLLSKYGGCLKGAECVSKSFPGFFDCLRTLGVHVRIDESPQRTGFPSDQTDLMASVVSGRYGKTDCKKQKNRLWAVGGTKMNLEFERKLTIPMHTKQMYPVSASVAASVSRGREAVRAVFEGRSDRLLLLIGPCSADNPDSVLDYLLRLRKLQEQVKERILIVPRVYTNKPRTTTEGYKGLLHQPDSQEKPDLFKGIIAVRELHLRAVRETGFVCADELLYPENYRYIDDLLGYVTVGARSVENQQHRLTASGIEVPVGMKNPTSGDLQVMLHAVAAAQHPHSFLYRGWAVHSQGNPHAHAILRCYRDLRGNSHPNYHREDLRRLLELYREAKLQFPALIVDANHDNSGKDPLLQPGIVREVLRSREEDPEIKTLVKGFMIESYLEDGCQQPGEQVYGKSITDPCLGWEKTEKLIYEIAEQSS